MNNFKYIRMRCKFMAILSYKDIPISKKYYSDKALFYLSDDQILELFILYL